MRRAQVDDKVRTKLQNEQIQEAHAVVGEEVVSVNRMVSSVLLLQWSSRQMRVLTQWCVRSCRGHSQHRGQRSGL